MKSVQSFKLRSFTLYAALLASFGIVTYASAQEHSYLIDLNGNTTAMLDIENPAALNDTGQVAGNSTTNTGAEHAFITRPGGIEMIDLGSLYPPAPSHASDLNSVGQVVGYSYRIGFITGSDGADMRGIGTLGGFSSVAAGINDTGQVVGTADTRGGNGDLFGPSHAFITGPDGAGMTDLGTLGGSSSGASRINATGKVIGSSATTSGDAGSFEWRL